MNRARDRRVNDPAYIQWQKEYAAEQAATPEAQFQRAANAEAAANRQGVLTTPLNDAYLATFGKVVRPPFNEDYVEQAMAKFEAESDFVRSRGNAEVLVDFMDRNNLSHAETGSFLLAHAILKLWNCYPDEVTPVEVEQAAPEQVLSRSDQMIVDHQNYMDKIVGTDELGKSWTSAELDRLDAKSELRLRRLFEKGHRGSSLLDVYREVKDIQEQQEIERARRAEEQQ